MIWWSRDQTPATQGRKHQRCLLKCRSRCRHPWNGATPPRAWGKGAGTVASIRQREPAARAKANTDQVAKRGRVRARTPLQCSQDGEGGARPTTSDARDGWGRGQEAPPNQAPNTPLRGTREKTRGNLTVSVNLLRVENAPHRGPLWKLLLANARSRHPCERCWGVWYCTQACQRDH